MEKIRVIEKPDWVSWEHVAECIHVGQATNNKKGFDMEFGHYTAEQLRDNIKGKNGEGYTFVALNEQNKVVGTVSLRVDTISKWWHKGRCGYHCEGATLPEYRGTDVYFDLHKLLDEKEDEIGIDVIWGSTSEKNLDVIKIHKKLKWKFVEYNIKPRKRAYFSYVFVKWKKGCPYKDWYINFRFKLSKFIIPIVYKYNGSIKVNRFTNWMHKDR